MLSSSVHRDSAAITESSRQTPDQRFDELMDPARVVLVLGIGRIEEDDERLGVDRLERPDPAISVGGDDAATVLESERRQVAVDQGDVLAFPLDEDSPRRTPAERLEPECTGAREQVDDEPAGDLRPKDVEERFPHQVAGRPGVAPLGAVELVATPLPGNDPHAASIPWAREMGNG